MQNSILLIIFGSILGILLLYLLKKYFNGGKCTINEDLSRKVIFITGGNGGIGAETAKILGKMKGTIIIACRDVRKANILLDEIKSEFRDSGDLYSLKMDLTDLGSIDSALEQFKTFNLNKVDILINNAGVMAPQEYKETKQGFELQFGVNYIGHFYLSWKLLPYLRNSEDPRIVNVSSLAHGQNSGFDISDLNCKRYAQSSQWSIRYTMYAYGYSKLCNILHAIQFYKQFRIPVYSLHPGVVRTDLGAELFGGWRKCIYYLIYPFWWFMTKSSIQGAQTTVYCALELQQNLTPGGYYSDCKLKTPKFANEQLASDLWDETLRILNEKQIKL